MRQLQDLLDRSLRDERQAAEERAKLVRWVLMLSMLDLLDRSQLELLSTQNADSFDRELNVVLDSEKLPIIKARAQFIALNINHYRTFLDRAGIMGIDREKNPDIDAFLSYTASDFNEFLLVARVNPSAGESSSAAPAGSVQAAVAKGGKKKKKTATRRIANLEETEGSSSLPRTTKKQRSPRTATVDSSAASGSNPGILSAARQREKKPKRNTLAQPSSEVSTDESSASEVITVPAAAQGAIGSSPVTSSPTSSVRSASSPAPFGEPLPEVMQEVLLVTEAEKLVDEKNSLVEEVYATASLRAGENKIILKNELVETLAEYQAQLNLLRVMSKINVSDWERTLNSLPNPNDPNDPNDPNEWPLGKLRQALVSSREGSFFGRKARVQNVLNEWIASTLQMLDICFATVQKRLMLLNESEASVTFRLMHEVVTDVYDGVAKNEFSLFKDDHCRLDQIERIVGAVDRGITLFKAAEQALPNNVLDTLAARSFIAGQEIETKVRNVEKEIKQKSSDLKRRLRVYTDGQGKFEQFRARMAARTQYFDENNQPVDNPVDNRELTQTNHPALNKACIAAIAVANDIPASGRIRAYQNHLDSVDTASYQLITEEISRKLMETMRAQNEQESIVNLAYFSLPEDTDLTQRGNGPYQQAAYDMRRSLFMRYMGEAANLQVQTEQERAHLKGAEAFVTQKLSMPWMSCGLYTPDPEEVVPEGVVLNKRADELKIYFALCLRAENFNLLNQYVLGDNKIVSNDKVFFGNEDAFYSPDDIRGKLLELITQDNLVEYERLAEDENKDLYAQFLDLIRQVGSEDDRCYAIISTIEAIKAVNLFIAHLTSASDLPPLSDREIDEAIKNMSNAPPAYIQRLRQAYVDRKTQLMTPGMIDALGKNRLDLLMGEFKLDSYPSSTLFFELQKVLDPDFGKELLKHFPQQDVKINVTSKLVNGPPFFYFTLENFIKFIYGKIEIRGIDSSAIKDDTVKQSLIPLLTGTMEKQGILSMLVLNSDEEYLLISKHIMYFMSSITAEQVAELESINRTLLIKESANSIEMRHAIQAMHKFIRGEVSSADQVLTEIAKIPAEHESAKAYLENICKMIAGAEDQKYFSELLPPDDLMASRNLRSYILTITDGKNKDNPEVVSLDSEGWDEFSLYKACENDDKAFADVAQSVIDSFIVERSYDYCFKYIDEDSYLIRGSNKKDEKNNLAAQEYRSRQRHRLLTCYRVVLMKGSDQQKKDIRTKIEALELFYFEHGVLHDATDLPVRLHLCEELFNLAKLDTAHVAELKSLRRRDSHELHESYEAYCARGYVGRLNKSIFELITDSLQENQFMDAARFIKTGFLVMNSSDQQRFSNDIIRIIKERCISFKDDVTMKKFIDSKIFEVCLLSRDQAFRETMQKIKTHCQATLVFSENINKRREELVKVKERAGQVDIVFRSLPRLMGENYLSEDTKTQWSQEKIPEIKRALDLISDGQFGEGVAALEFESQEEVIHERMNVSKPENKAKHIESLKLLYTNYRIEGRDQDRSFEDRIQFANQLNKQIFLPDYPEIKQALLEGVEVLWVYFKLYKEQKTPAYLEALLDTLAVCAKWRENVPVDIIKGLFEILTADPIQDERVAAAILKARDHIVSSEQPNARILKMLLDLNASNQEVITLILRHPDLDYVEFQGRIGALFNLNQLCLDVIPPTNKVFDSFLTLMKDSTINLLGEEQATLQAVLLKFKNTRFGVRVADYIEEFTERQQVFIYNALCDKDVQDIEADTLNMRSRLKLSMISRSTTLNFLHTCAQLTRIELPESIQKNISTIAAWPWGDEDRIAVQALLKDEENEAGRALLTAALKSEENKAFAIEQLVSMARMGPQPAWARALLCSSNIDIKLHPWNDEEKIVVQKLLEDQSNEAGRELMVAALKSEENKMFVIEQLLLMVTAGPQRGWARSLLFDREIDFKIKLEEDEETETEKFLGKVNPEPQENHLLKLICCQIWLENNKGNDAISFLKTRLPENEENINAIYKECDPALQLAIVGKLTQLGMLVPPYAGDIGASLMRIARRLGTQKPVDKVPGQHVPAVLRAGNSASGSSQHERGHTGKSPGVR